MRTMKICTDILVIGGTIEAFRYARKNKCHAIYHKPEPPHFLDSDRELIKEWEDHCAFLSLRGFLPFADKIRSMRLLEDNTIRVILRNTFVSIDFSKLVIFSPEKIEGLPAPTGRTSTKYKVIDWIDMRAGMTHEHKRIESTTDFVNCILFYPSQRLDGYHPTKKDAAAISYIEEDKLDNIEWSDSYARLKAISIMKEAGIKVPAYKIETSYREIIPLGKYIYPTVDSVEFK
jgi:hypothetical protein